MADNMIPGNVCLRLIVMCALPMCWVSLPASAAQPLPGETAEDGELGGLDIEQLANIKVSLAARVPVSIAKTPAALSVITQDDIRRDGALSIPEALRLAPGIDVAQIDSGRYAIGIRGFNQEFANKLLVLEDRRPVYTPLFGGVLWEAQDTFVQDLDRIEIVRGPGGTLWGANAVNGVINIQPKLAQETQGWLAHAGGGNAEKAFAGVRYGGKWGRDRFYRVWAKSYHRGELGAGDDSGGTQALRAGFRSDFEAQSNTYMISGSLFRTWAGRALLVTVPASVLPQSRRGKVFYTGASVTGRWTHTFSGDTSLRSQLSIDSLTRDSQPEKVRGAARLLDADMQHSFRPWKRHMWVWGVGYQLIWDRIEPSFLVSLSPESQLRSLFTFFVKDELELVTDYLWLIAGSKFERNAITGFEYQPDARVSWKPADNHLVWAAISRAVRTPTRIETDARAISVNREGPVPVRFIASEALPAETLYAYEIGYRAQWLQRATLDASGFAFDYRQLHGPQFEAFDPGTRPPTLRVKEGLLGGARSYGGEISMNIDLGNRVFLRPSYSFLELDVRPRAPLFAVLAKSIEGQSPRHQAAMRTGWKIADPWRADAGLFYVSKLPAFDMPSYWDLHASLAWRPLEKWELALAGRHLVGPSHSEFATSSSPRRLPELEPSVFAELTVEM